MQDAGMLSQEEAFARIQLIRTPHLGPVTFLKLLHRYGSAIAALDALPQITGRSGRKLTPPDKSSVQAEIAALKRTGGRYLFHDAPEYPALLKTTSGAPPVLTYKGDVSLLSQPCVAVVGARNASAAAMQLAHSLAYDLAKMGWVVVSGLARGIDGAAHKGALAAGAKRERPGGSMIGDTPSAKTIGVIASGIDIAYPPQHVDLHEEVGAHGLLLAEQPAGAEPLARHFPARNRIIAGLCAGTVVVEAAPKSGSLITARLAADMGREVMAVPGSPLDPRSQGCNALIREGAVLVQNAQDIIELLSDFSGMPRSRVQECDVEWSGEGDSRDIVPDAHNDLTLLLGPAPVLVDELIRQSGVAPAHVHSALLELELSGRLARHAGGKVSLL